MAFDPTNARVLLSVPSEEEGALILRALEECGVEALAVGGHTSAFKCAAPGEVAILVSGRHIQRAREALTEIRQLQSEVNWSCVDVGESQDDEAEADFCEPACESSGNLNERGSVREPMPLVARGRFIFLALVAGDILLTAWTKTHVGLGNVWLSALALGLHYGLWYACWRGYQWAVVLLVIGCVLGAVLGCLPPYVVDGFSLVPGTIFAGIIAITFLSAPGLKEFLSYQRAQRKSNAGKRT